MNKILMDGDKILLSSDISNIEVSGYATILINNNSDDINLNIELKDDSELSIYDFNLSNKNTKIVVNQSNNTKMNYVHTFKIDGNYNFDYLVNINGNNNINNINISGVTNGNVAISVDGVVKPGVIDNELNENIKILTEGGKAFVSPMLHVSAKEVVANHNTAISSVREDELFYLMSKGINKNDSISLIEDGYIYGYIKKYNEEFYNMIKD